MIEILVVITIIGILATLILTNFGPSRAKARDVQRKTDLNQIKTALALYYNVWNEYPDGSSGSIVGCGPATLPPAPCSWGSVWNRDNLVYMKLLPSDALAPSREYSYTSSDNNSFTIKALLENKLDKVNYPSSPMHGKHVGDEIIKKYIIENSPELYIGSHMHEWQGSCRIGRTTIINSGYGKEGKGVLIDLPNCEIKFVKI